jgi:hypothetical protein
MAEGLGKIGNWCLQGKNPTYLIAVAGNIIAKLDINEPQPDLIIKDGKSQFTTLEAKRDYTLKHAVWENDVVDLDLTDKEIDVIKKCFSDQDTLKAIQGMHIMKHTVMLLSALGLDKE